MNPRELFLGVMRGETIDRVPLVLEGFACATLGQIAAVEDPGRREIMERSFAYLAAPVAAGYMGNRTLMIPEDSFTTMASRKDGRGRTIDRVSVKTPKGDLLIESMDGGIVGKNVVANHGLSHRPPHLGCRPRYSVASEVRYALGHVGRVRCRQVAFSLPAFENPNSPTLSPILK